MVSELDQLSPGMRPKGLSAPESFSIAAVGASGSKHTVVLCGADMRGTIYAIYQFSQEHLGIDPMYYWTDRLPQHRSQIALPSSLAEIFPAPVFKYRGFFINDEDLLTGWAPGDKDKTGISLVAWNKVYETILRLKGNMVVPGTWIFPDDPQVALAGKRGLILTQHHAIPLGLNVSPVAEGRALQLLHAFRDSGASLEGCGRNLFSHAGNSLGCWIARSF